MPEADEAEEYPEGRLMTRIHKARERHAGLRKKLLERTRRRGGIRCEACDARPRIAGDIALELAAAEYEVHHVQPLALAVERKTKLEDLALLCANCHRLIHALARTRRMHVDVALLKAALLPS